MRITLSEHQQVAKDCCEERTWVQTVQHLAGDCAALHLRVMAQLDRWLYNVNMAITQLVLSEIKARVIVGTSSAPGILR